MICKFVRTGRKVGWWVLMCAALLPAHSQDLLLCGSYNVRALRVAGTNASTLWTWNATNSNLPQSYWAAFTNTSECKPCPGGRVLVTSSGGSTNAGAVALVNPESANVLFYASAVNAHSADLLPSNRVAVALSYDTNGNRMAIFNLSTPDVEILSVPLHGAHGVVWDEQRQVLWGLSDSFIAGYRLTNWNSQPDLVKVYQTALPDGGGHDMYPVPNSPNLMIATALHVWLLDRDTQWFTKHPLLGDTPNAKATSMHPVMGQIVYVTSDGPWWSEHLRFGAPTNTVDFPGDRLYKARWVATDGSPRLSIGRTSTNTTLVSWPTGWTNFALQQSATFNSTNWSAPVESIDDDGTNKFIIINPTNQRFYRLLKSSP